MSHVGPIRRDSLPMLEATVLWSIRAWVIGFVHGEDVRARIQTLFNALRAPAAAAALSDWMDALRRGDGPVLEVNCVCVQTISQDESMLLDVLALLGEGQSTTAYGLLATLVDAEAAAEAVGAAARLMSALTEAGHHMPRARDALFRHTAHRIASLH